MMAAAAATRALAWAPVTTPPKSVRWRTPPAIYQPLDHECNFTLDAAACAETALHVKYLDKASDALKYSWAGERVFCNPPFGRHLDRWLRKALFETQENGCQLVAMLIPARTGNAWFHDLVLGKAEIRFIRGRLNYKLPPEQIQHQVPALDPKARKKQPKKKRRNGAPFDSMIVIYRPPLDITGLIHNQRQLLFPFLSRSVGLLPPGPKP